MFYEHVMGNSPGSGCLFPWQQGKVQRLGSIMNIQTHALASWHAVDDEKSNSATVFDIFPPNPFFALDWKVRWEGYRCFSCARCIWLCVVLSFCVSSCLMQAHAERREGDGSLCVCIHGKSTCLVLHSMLQTNESTEPVCVKSQDSIDLNMDLGGRWRIIHTSKATGQQSL